MERTDVDYKYEYHRDGIGLKTVNYIHLIEQSMRNVKMQCFLSSIPFSGEVCEHVVW